MRIGPFVTMALSCWLTCLHGFARGQSAGPILLHFDDGKVEGKFGRAWFLGVGEETDGAYIKIPELERRNVNALTVECWIRPRLEEWPRGNYNVFVGWWGGPIWLAFDGGANLYLHCYGVMPLSADQVVPASKVREITTEMRVYASPPLPRDWWRDGKWHHVAGGWDCAAGTVRLFFDGKLVGQREGDPFELLNRCGGYVFGPPGQIDQSLCIDEARISFRLLDEGEIKRSFEAQEAFED